MNPNPNLNFNIIKGLQIFINDIRECNTKEAEAKRVEQELNKVRTKFSSSKALSGYEKKKCVWKLLYIYILGYKVDFGYNYACDLITSIKFSEKMTGYVAMSILFRDNNPEIDIMINSIRNDLLNQNSFCQSMALTLATNLGNADLLAAIAQDVLKIMISFGEKQIYTVKKALICLSKIIKAKKDVHDASTWSKYLMKIIDMKNFEALLACGGLVLNIFYTFGTSGYEELMMKFFNSILYSLSENKKECPEEYMYYHIKAPWLQIKILKMLQCCNIAIFDSNTIGHLKEYVDYFAKKTQGIVGKDTKFSRYYAEYCIFFEIINVIDHFHLKVQNKTFENYISLLGNFLQDDHRKYPNKDINTKYLALDGMAKLCKYSSGNKIFKEHSAIILSSLRDNDVSIRRRALDLLFLTCTQDSVKMIIKELLIYLKEDEPQLKDDVTLKIAILSEKYASDYSWYIDVCIKMLELAGDFVSDDILHRIIQIVTGFENKEADTKLQVHACEKIIKLLQKDYAFESVVRLAALLLGDFGNLLTKKREIEANDNDNNEIDDQEIDSDEILTMDKQIELLWKHIGICSNKTIYCMLNCLMKFVTINPDIRAIAIPKLEQYLESWDPELQQRSVEYLILCKLDGEVDGINNMQELRSILFERMPPYSQDIFNNSLLMKRLQKSQTGIYVAGDANAGASNKQKNVTPQIPTQSTSSVAVESPNLKEGDIANASELLATSAELSSKSNPFADHVLYIKDPNGFAVNMNKNPSTATLIDRDAIINLDLFKSMITNNSPNGGLIYSDTNSLKVNLVIKRLDHGILGYIFCFIPPGSTEKLEDIEFFLENYTTSEMLMINISKVKYDQHYPQVMMKVQMNDSFSLPPIVQFNGTLGMRKINFSFTIPLLITKFLEPMDMTIENFTPLWYEYSNTPEETFQKLDSILYNPMANKSLMEFLKKLGNLLHNLNFKVYPPSDPTNFHEIEGCANFITREGSSPVLFQVCFLPSFPDEFRFSLRSKDISDRYGTLLLDIYSVVKFWVNP